MSVAKLITGIQVDNHTDGSHTLYLAKMIGTEEVYFHRAHFTKGLGFFFEETFYYFMKIEDRFLLKNEDGEIILSWLLPELEEPPYAYTLLTKHGSISSLFGGYPVSNEQ